MDTIHIIQYKITLNHDAGRHEPMLEAVPAGMINGIYTYWEKGGGGLVLYLFQALARCRCVPGWGRRILELKHVIETYTQAVRYVSR